MTNDERVDISRVELGEILSMRDLYRREMRCQIVHDSHHARGFLDSWLIRVDDRIAGYGSVGGYREDPRITIKEFFLLPPDRADELALFRHFVRASDARRIEVQTNDLLLTRRFFDCVERIEREKILFHDAFTSGLFAPNARFRALTESERSRVFPHQLEPVGDWVVDVDGTVAATGGILLHYNAPFADLHMEVHEDFRRRGYGSYLVQELKRACYEMGRVPAARCDPSNLASRATLEKAGMLPCGVILSGRIVT